MTKQQARQLEEAGVLLARLLAFFEKKHATQEITRMLDRAFECCMQNEDLITTCLTLGNQVSISLPKEVGCDAGRVTLWKGMTREDMKTVISFSVLQGFVKAHHAGQT